MPGKPCSAGCECGKHRPRFRESAPNWKGDSVGYDAAHFRLRDQRGRAREFDCATCGERADEWAYLGGAPDEQKDAATGRPYTLDLSFYVPLCRHCHRRSDSNNPKRRARGLVVLRS